MQAWLSSIWTHIKAAFKSVAVWCNGVVTAAAVAVPALADQFSSLQPYVPANLFSKAMFGLAVVNVVIHTRAKVKAQTPAAPPSA